MISILIPVHNYNIVSLATALHKQLKNAEISFELLACDDGSESHFLEVNKKINAFSFTDYILLNQNIGRENTRQILAQKAKYDWLLFLDADVLPISSDFIKSYLPYLSSTYDAVFGGIVYQQEPPEADYMLRWKYGTTREAVNAEVRNKNPYKTVVSPNFIIKKSIFIELNAHITGKDYGYDTLFASLLKSNAIEVIHIDNQVYHLGLEKSDRYLSKKEEAANTLLKLYKENKINNEDNGLLKLFITLKSYGLHHMLPVIYTAFQVQMKSNLLGKNPSINILQLYRISYMCHKFKNK